jgi:hypothetical protein
MDQLPKNLFAITTTILFAITPGCTEGQLTWDTGGADGTAQPQDVAPPNERSGASMLLPVDDGGGGGGGGGTCHRTGMTWHWDNRTIDVDAMGSDATTDPYFGDTSCNNQLPILCIRKVGAPQPSYITTDFYSGWTGGYVTMTRAHFGYEMSSPSVADGICASELGAGWEMAEFHDGNGGWHFQAYGAATHLERFWVMINDQPANCWDSACVP